MSTKNLYDSHDFDIRILEGSALRLVHGEAFTRKGIAIAKVPANEKYPLIYSISGLALLSGAFWASIALVLLH